LGGAILFLQTLLFRLASAARRQRPEFLDNVKSQ